MPDQDKETTRIEAFSDGVIAIIITLLVFNLRVPAESDIAEGGLLRALTNQWPMYLAFTISFFFVLVMWINHHRLFTAIRRSDNTLLLLNGLLLFGISLVPFTTAVVAEYLDHPEQAAAVLVYNGWFFIISIFFNGLWAYAAGDGGRLFSKNTDPALVKFISRQYSFGPFLYLGAVLVAFVSPALSLLINVGLAIFFAMPNRAVTQLIETR